MTREHDVYQNKHESIAWVILGKVAHSPYVVLALSSSAGLVFPRLCLRELLLWGKKTKEKSIALAGGKKSE